MGLLKELTEMSREELLELFDRNLEEGKQNHEITVKLGSKAKVKESVKV